MTLWILLLACGAPSEAPVGDPPAPAAPAVEPASAAEPAAAPATPGEPSTGAKSEPEGDAVPPAEAVAEEPAPAPRAAHADASPDEQPEAPTERDGPRPEPVGDGEPEAEADAEADGAATDEADAAPEPSGPVTYQLDPGSSQLAVVVRKADTVGAAVSHDHVVEAKGWSGTVTWDAHDLSSCAVTISVPVAKLANDATALREAFGLEGSLERDQRADIHDNMLAKDQLDASNHGTITFTADSCSESGDQVQVKGPLTIRGKASTVTATLSVDATPEGFSASGSFRSSHTAHGFDPFSALFGALKNEDALSFSLRVVGAPR